MELLMEGKNEGSLSEAEWGEECSMSGRGTEGREAGCPTFN